MMKVEAVVIRDRISKVTAARQLFEQLLRPRSQIEVEVDFIEISRHDLLHDGGELSGQFATQSVREDGPGDRQPHGPADLAEERQVARRNAKKLGRTLPSELQILILHGVLHLLGYDHETDRGQMDRLEARLRRKLGLT